MTDEETEVPAMKKYVEQLEMLDKTHEYAAKSWRRTIKDVANWKDMQLYLQKKYGVAPKTDSKAETQAVIPSRLGRLKNRLGEKWRNLAYGGMETHFEPKYSEAERNDRKEWKEDLRGFEEYNPEDSKGKKKMMETLFGTGKKDMKSRFKPEYFPEEEMEKKKWKWRFERFEEYDPKDSKKYGVKDRLMDIGTAIAKVKLGYGTKADNIDNYVELENALRKPERTDEKYTTANAAGAAQYVKKLHGKA